MMRVLMFWALTLTGCNTASGYFGQSSVTQFEVEGSIFDIRVRDEAALAVRVSAEFMPEGVEIRQKAQVAIQKVTGCQVEYVLGDNNIILGLMDCDGFKQDWSKILAVSGVTDYICYDINILSCGGPNGYTTFQCDSY